MCCFFFLLFKGKSHGEERGRNQIQIVRKERKPAPFVLKKINHSPATNITDITISYLTFLSFTTLPPSFVQDYNHHLFILYHPRHLQQAHRNSLSLQHPLNRHHLASISPSPIQTTSHLNRQNSTSEYSLTVIASRPAPVASTLQYAVVFPWSARNSCDYFEVFEHYWSNENKVHKDL
ncbi:unnamed protein product [Vicia faba]|uniref:Uncharacterized protein n=1 Tax=Vicia faba TaxID=3906 RepID=A0AAV1B6R0_VICFA|nr:unnamed protein product [Vicia faba]